jgi:hypothetical protein
VAKVDVFAKVMLAIAILVANGALLFFILRFLLWLAFPSMKDGAGAAPIPARTSAPAAGSAAVAALGAELATAPPEPVTAASPAGPGTFPVFAPSAPRPRAYPHRLLIGLPVILALFAGGVWLGSVVGGSGSAAAATTIRLKGKVVTVNSTMTEVKVPAIRTVVKGDVVTLPERTLPLPSHTVTSLVKVTRTRVLTLPGSTVLITTVLTIPTTVTTTGTVTVLSTTTETVTTTDSTGTTTTT